MAKRKELTKKEKERIVVSVEGGLIQDIIIPKNLNIVVEVRDYDTDGGEEDNLFTDDNGQYSIGEWE